MAGGNTMGRLGNTGVSGNQQQLGQQQLGQQSGLGPMGGNQPGGKFGGWAPAFQGGQAPQGVSAQYPQLFGGPYNQMTQQLAGPSYQQQGMPRPALAPTAQPPGGMGNPSAGAPPSLMNPSAGGWRGGYYGSQI